MAYYGSTNGASSGNDYYNYMGTERLYAYGGWGNDTIYGNTNDDVIFGEGNHDILAGWSGNDYLSGGTGNDKLYGGDGNDRLFDEHGNDWLVGGSGNDTLQAAGLASLSYASVGQGEFDVLNGGTGSDTFVLGVRETNYEGNFYRGEGHAIIEDYNALYDYIQVRGSASSFRLDKSQNLVGGAGLDTAIYSGNDLLAIVQDTTDLQLTNYYFKFV